MAGMHALPLDTLPTFAAVARQGSMRAAGEHLHLTHSAVSQQIRLLEQRLGFALFHRQGRRLVLTDAGRHMLAASEAALAQLETARREAQAQADGGGQRLRLAILPSFAQRWLAPRLPRWRQAHPGIHLELVASQHTADLQQEGLHAAVRQGAGHWRQLRAERLLHSPYVVVGSPRAAARLAATADNALLHEPLLGNTALWQAWLAQAGMAAARVAPVAAFNDAGLLLQAAEADVGLALVREVLAADALLDGRLVKLSPIALAESAAVAHHDLTASYWLAYPEGQEHWPPIVALRDWLHSELAASAQALQQQATRAAPDVHSMPI